MQLRTDIIVLYTLTICIIILYIYLLTLLTQYEIYREDARAIERLVLAVQQLNQFGFSGQLVRARCPLTFTWLRIFPRGISMRLTHGDFSAVRSETARKSSSIVRISPSSR